MRAKRTTIYPVVGRARTTGVMPDAIENIFFCLSCRHADPVAQGNINVSCEELSGKSRRTNRL